MGHRSHPEGKVFQFPPDCTHFLAKMPRSSTETPKLILHIAQCYNM